MRWHQDPISLSPAAMPQGSHPSNGATHPCPHTVTCHGPRLALGSLSPCAKAPEGRALHGPLQARPHLAAACHFSLQGPRTSVSVAVGCWLLPGPKRGPLLGRVAILQLFICFWLILVLARDCKHLKDSFQSPPCAQCPARGRAHGGPPTGSTE